MSYTSRHGRRPAEYASKSAHTNVINDTAVQEFLAKAHVPKTLEEVSLPPANLLPYQPPANNPIRFFVAIDSGFSEVAVKKDFPSATICFFQFGALIFSLDDLIGVQRKPFIDPAEMAALKNIERRKLTLPVRNVTLNSATTLTQSVREALYEFFLASTDGRSLMQTLKWLIFEEYAGPASEWVLASCPVCQARSVPLKRAEMTAQYAFACPFCKEQVLLTDVFRLHEAVDDEIGAGGVLGYVATTLEQIILVDLIKIVLETKPALLKQIMFIKDGPLAFFGQTANMHKPMRALIRYLFQEHDLFLAGLEKSGAFVEHADQVASLMANGSVLILDNDYIYKYVVPGKADPTNAYGRTTYYGSKLIFKTPAAAMHVITLPTTDVTPEPKVADFRNLFVDLANCEMLKCDMYDNALFPVALVNKLVSLSNHPSSAILQKFAVGAMK